MAQRSLLRRAAPGPPSCWYVKVPFLRMNFKDRYEQTQEQGEINCRFLAARVGFFSVPISFLWCLSLACKRDWCPCTYSKRLGDNEREGALCPLSPSVGHPCCKLTAFEWPPWPQPSSENTEVTELVQAPDSLKPNIRGLSAKISLFS